MKKDSFEKKLAAYVATAAAYLAAHPFVADAQIMYTDVNPDVTINQGGYFNLDLNNDGVVDFKLRVNNESDEFNTCLNSNQAIVVTGSTSSNSIYLHAVPSGDTIDSLQHFGVGNILHMFTSYLPYATSIVSYVVTSNGEFHGNNLFLGLKIVSGGITN